MGRRTNNGVRKQISIFVPLEDWRAIRLEAARLRIPITELCRRWMSAELNALRDRHDAANGTHTDEHT